MNIPAPFHDSVDQIVAANPDQPYSPEVLARIGEIEANATRNVEFINARIEPHIPRFNRVMNSILRSQKSKDLKFYALWALADEMNFYNGDDVACRRGCSSCCHIAVAITPEEARAIGKRIGLQPKKANLRSNFSNFDFGYHNPCTFLKDNLCSIYDNRPLTCRVHYSLDIDPLMCQFDGHQTRPVPLFNRLNFHFAEVQIAAPKQKNCTADIRAFFPRSRIGQRKT